MEDKSRYYRTQGNHSSHAQVRTCQKNQPCNPKGIEHPCRRLFQNRKYIRQSQKVTGSDSRCNGYADDEENYNGDVKAVVKEKFGKLETVSVVYESQLGVFDKIGFFIAKPTVYGYVVGKSLLFCITAAFNCPKMPVFFVKEGSLKLVAGSFLF